MHILLVGDSIRIDYCQYVKEKLAGYATVGFSEDNARFSKNVLFFIRHWISLHGENADVVVLNCGLWDVVHMWDAEYTITSIDEYRSDLEKIVGQIRAALPNAKIIWATTTPVDEQGNRASRPDHMRYNKDICAFNDCAAELMRSLDCEICDLHAVIQNQPLPLWKDGVHYISEGCELLADAVVEKIRSVINL